MARITNFVKEGGVNVSADRVNIPLYYCFDNNYFVFRLKPTTDSNGYGKISIQKDKAKELIKLLENFIKSK